MKRHLNILMVIVIVVGAFTVAQAQTTSSQKVDANIPFAFSVANTNLPAGKYTIAVVNPTSDRKILQIRSADGKSSAIVLTTGVIGKASDDAKLVFHRYGDQYLFAQAQMAGDTVSLAAVKSRAERAKKALTSTAKKSVVMIVAE
jgi:hypothetical protein